MAVDLKTTLPTIGALVLVSILGGVLDANAKPLYAKTENKKCVYCHINPSGGERGFRGIYYKLHGHSFKGFDEHAEALKAGLKPGSTGEATRPTKHYPPSP